MRILLAYSSEPHYMSPPRLGEHQVNVGPYFHDRRCHDQWTSFASPRGDYDLAKIVDRLPASQQPDIVAVHVDGASMAGTPRNLAAFKCPKVLLVADTHHGASSLAGMIRYALSEPFDRVVLLYDRHHADFFRAAGIKNLHWLPSLTFAHSDARVAAAQGARREPRIAIVGTTSYHPRRLRLFSGLVSRKLPLDWREIQQCQAIEHYAASLVGLNASMNGDLNMRVFEILAGGAVLLTDRLAPASGLTDLLKEDRDFVGYSTLPELLDKASALIGRPADAATIAANGASWFREHFTEKHRRQAFLDLALDGRERPEFAIPESRIQIPATPSLDSLVGGYHWTQLQHQKTEELRIVVDPAAPAAFAEMFATLPRIQILPRPTSGDPVDLWVTGVSTPPPVHKARHVWFWDAPESSVPAILARFAPQQWRAVAGTVPLFACAPADAKDQPDPLAAKSRAHLQQGDLVGALRHGTAALQANPKSVDALFVITELSIDAQNWDTANAMLAKARTLAPQHPLVALLARQIALKAPPRQARRLLSVARLAFDWRDHLRARNYALLALEADPECADAHHLLGLLDFHHAGESATRASRIEALQRLRRACELHPSRADYWLELGLAAQQLDTLPEAAAALRRAIELEPSALACLALGRCLLAVDDRPGAIAAFGKGLALSPDDVHLLEGLQLAKSDSITRASSDPASTVPAEFRPIAEAVRNPHATTPEEICRELIELCDHLARHPALSANLPSRRVLLAYQPWFGLHLPQLLSEAHARGVFVTLLDETTQPNPVEIVDADNIRTLAHHGVNLWQVSRYRLALELRKTPAQFDANNPSDLAALRSFYGHAVELVDKARAHLDRFQPDTIVVAQGYDVLSAVLRHLAILRGIRVVSLENTFRRDRLLWDDTSGISVNLNLAKNHYWRLRDFISEDTARQTAAAYLAGIKTAKSGEHASPSAPLSADSSADNLPTITYLAQVGTDSSVLFGLRRFQSQLDVIVALAAYAARRSARLLVKLHPKENPAFNDAMPWVRGLTAEGLSRREDFAASREQLGDRLVLDADNRYDTYDLIRRADVCVTINSQAGLEAALHDKEVVLCGDAFYGGLGFTHEADDSDALAFHLDRVLDGKLRLNTGGAARVFFHIYTEHYCLPKTEQSVLALLQGRPPFALPAQTSATEPSAATPAAA